MSTGLPFESLLSPVGYSSSSCGYCRPPSTRKKESPVPKTSRSYGLWAHTLSAEHYQTLMDSGWRRSGCYVYRPDLARTCCKQMTIRLEVDRFKLGKSARKLLRKVLLSELTTHQDVDDDQRIWGKGKGKGKYSAPTSLKEYYDLIEGRGDGTTISNGLDTHQARWKEAQEARSSRVASTSTHYAQPPLLPSGHRMKFTLKTRLASPQANPAKYALFRRYQMQIHGESEDQVSDMKGFQRFLCDSPIDEGPLGSRQDVTAIDVSSSNSTQWEFQHGLYHLEWYLHEVKTGTEKLIGISVLDVLPCSLSSVYFFYDPDYEKSLQLGKLSALKEILLVQELRTRAVGLQELKYYAMGFYIHNCQKMKYKMRYRPSEILDVTTGRYVDSLNIAHLLDAGRSYGFSGDANGHTPVVQSNAPAESDSSDGGEKVVDSDWSSSSDSDTDETALPTDPLPPGTPLDPEALNVNNLARVFILDVERQDQGITLLGNSPLLLTPNPDDARLVGSKVPPTSQRIQDLKECVAVLGWNIVGGVVFFI